MIGDVVSQIDVLKALPAGPINRPEDIESPQAAPLMLRIEDKIDQRCRSNCDIHRTKTDESFTDSHLDFTSCSRIGVHLAMHCLQGFRTAELPGVTGPGKRRPQMMLRMLVSDIDIFLLARTFRCDNAAGNISIPAQDLLLIIARGELIDIDTIADAHVAIGTRGAIPYVSTATETHVDGDILNSRINFIVGHKAGRTAQAIWKITTFGLGAPGEIYEHPPQFVGSDDFLILCHGQNSRAANPINRAVSRVLPSAPARRPGPAQAA